MARLASGLTVEKRDNERVTAIPYDGSYQSFYPSCISLKDVVVHCRRSCRYTIYGLVAGGVDTVLKVGDSEVGRGGWRGDTYR